MLSHEADPLPILGCVMATICAVPLPDALQSRDQAFPKIRVVLPKPDGNRHQPASSEGQHSGQGREPYGAGAVDILICPCSNIFSPKGVPFTDCRTGSSPVRNPGNHESGVSPRLQTLSPCQHVSSPPCCPARVPSHEPMEAFNNYPCQVKSNQYNTAERLIVHHLSSPSTLPAG